MKLAVNLWTVYGWSLAEPVSDDVVREIAKLGSHGLELVFDDDRNSVAALLHRREPLGALLTELGLEIPSVASTLCWRDNLAANDVATRSRALDSIRDGCRLAQAYRAPVLLVLAGQLAPGTEYGRGYATSVETMRRAGELAAAHGIVLGVENVDPGLLRSPGELARYLGDVAHPAVRAYLDIANGCYLGASAEAWIQALAGRIACVHAKDLARGEFLPCGRGELDWRAAMAALHGAGYDGYVTIEAPYPPGLAAARTSLEELSRWL